MLRKRGVTEDVYGTALQRLSARAKAGLPEPQCPGGGTRTPVGSTSVRRRHREPQVNVSLEVRLARWAMASEAIQGHEYGAYVAL